jgi:hypothetical protein
MSLPLTNRLRTAANAVYLATEEGPAKAISNLLLEAAAEIERLSPPEKGHHGANTDNQSRPDPDKQ